MRLPASRVLSKATVDRMRFPATCDLYKPGRLAPIPGSTDNPSGIQVGDTAYSLATQNVPCFFSPAPENNVSVVMGRVGADNIYTLDKFVFPSGVEASDGWVLVYLGAGDNYREVYVLQGDPLAGNPHPLHFLTVQTFLAKRVSSTVHPAGIVIRNPLGVA